MDKKQEEKLAKFFADAFHEVVMPHLEEMSDNICSLQKDVKDVKTRLGEVEDGLGKVETALGSVEDRLDKIEDHLDRGDAKLDDHEKRVISLEENFQLAS